MTREEAIFILKRDNPNNIAIRTGFESLYDQRKEAFSMAIKALEQEPRKGYISIDDVMLVFDDYMRGEVDAQDTETFLEMLKDKAESEEEPADDRS